VVHHGGAGTVMAAARAGVPQVIIPHLLDQYYWGQRVVTLGIGPQPLPINRLNAQTLARTLCRMLASPGMRARARILAKPLCGRDGASEAATWIMTRPRTSALFTP
jgi:UDP:flavonoid glycosyltransferase YjiC (YdhE family)